MKKLLAFIFIAVLFTSARVAPTQDQLIGTWTLIALQYKYPDGTVLAKQDLKNTSIKIYTKLYFSYGNLKDVHGALDAAGGGTYRISGLSIYEKYNYSMNESLIGKEIEYHTNIRNDTLAIFGLLPDGTHIFEVYKQLESTK